MARVLLCILAVSLITPAAAAPPWVSPTWISPNDVFVSGKEGYPWYRIPAMVRLPDGGIAAFTEGRKTGRDIGYNDIVYKVSRDQGASWTPLRVLWSESNATHHVAIHNPVPVVTGGKVLVVFNRNMRDCLTLRSLDGSGTRWAAAPVDITPQLTNRSGVFTTGPPQGLVLPSGRIVIAAGGSSIQGGRAILSDDGGARWRVSGLANPKGGEAQVVAAQNGSLLLNSRGPAQVRGSLWSWPRSWANFRLLY
jgi:sialidase-1